jgi:hypothetical protein
MLFSRPLGGIVYFQFLPCHAIAPVTERRRMETENNNPKNPVNPVDISLKLLKNIYGVSK